MGQPEARQRMILGGDPKSPQSEVGNLPDAELAAGVDQLFGLVPKMKIASPVSFLTTEA